MRSKHAAVHGIDLQAVAAVLVGGGATVVFVRRQLRLVEPLLDMKLFTNPAFSAALSVLLIGLAGFGGVMFLVTQYLQFVTGLSPTVTGLWMGPPALAMLVGAIGAPLLTDRFSPGVIMAGTLALSLAGYGLLASAGTGSKPAVVGGFALVYLGLGVIAALGTDIVMGAAPPDKSGSAAALSETVQEFGIAAGVALLGSLTAAIYRRDIETPAGLPASVAETYGNSLSGAASVADRIPAGAVDHARSVFTDGLGTASLVAGIAIAFASSVCFVMLRHIRPPGEAERATEPIASTPGSNR